MNNWKVFYNAYKNVFWGSLLLWYIVFSLFVYFSLKPEIPRGEVFKKVYLLMEIMNYFVIDIVIMTGIYMCK